MGICNLVFFFVLFFSSVFVDGEGRGVFKVKHKFGSAADRSLKELTVHDKNRHGRLLAAIDIPLGGDGEATGTGLYYTKLSIGSPPKDYFLHVDTGSDIIWINCVGCSPCATFTDIDNLTLKLYDPNLSSTAGLVPCNGGFCTEFSKGPIPGDGSGSDGYFFQDVIRFDQVTGNIQTSIGNASISLGCGMEQTGKLSLSAGALDGLIGFGASNTSILSQLASSRKTKKKFAHCLNGRNGGRIFVIGDVVQPILKTTPLVPNATHYNVNMESVRVGNTVLDIPKDIFKAGDGKGAIIDSGTTLAYLPGTIFDPLRRMANLNIHLVDGLLECFRFDKSIDDLFPTVIFGFQNSLELKVYPHGYLILYVKNERCFGWQDSGKLESNMVLTNKLVLYDIENQDEVSGAVNQVGSHDLSYSPTRNQMDISSSTAH
ncbi:hypothetical protein MKX03_029413 [Papaver bracteatum]|nr:hypothetical protein MKX03_029413 [Papaver bracteatum]